MEKFESIAVSIHKKEKYKTIWEVRDGESSRYIEIEVGRDRMYDALIHIMNALGKEGWFLATQPFYYRLYMQRKITEVST